MTSLRKDLSATAPSGNGIFWERTSPVDFNKPLVTSSLKAQSALVTGGASGIGAGIVTALAEAGAYVTSADLNENGRQLIDELKAKGFHAQFIKTDVLSWSSLVHAFRAAIDFAQHNSLDIVVTSAGLQSNSIIPWLAGTPIDTPDTELKPVASKTLEVNLLGTWYSTQLALHFLRFPAKDVPGAPKVQSKQLIFISSTGGYGGMHHSCDYNASKFGVRGLWYSLRHCTGLLGHGEVEGALPFRTNLIAPWFTHTGLISRFRGVLDRLGIRYADVSDVVDALLRCLTDEDVIGRAIYVAPDGKHGNNFDLCDEYDQGAGLDEIMKRVQSGVIQLDLLDTMKGKPANAPKWKAT